MSFLQVQQSVVTHRKTFRLAELLNVDRVTAVGIVVCFWAWCLDNALQGCLGNVGPQMLAYVVDWRKDAQELLDALITAGFIEVREDGSQWVHDWDEHMGRLIARRESNAERMRESRAKEKGEPEPRAQHVLRTEHARADAGQTHVLRKSRVE